MPAPDSAKAPFEGAFPRTPSPVRLPEEATRRSPANRNGDGECDEDDRRQFVAPVQHFAQPRRGFGNSYPPCGGGVNEFPRPG